MTDQTDPNEKQPTPNDPKSSSDQASFDFERMDKDVEEFHRAIRSRENPSRFSEEKDEYTDQVPAHFTPTRRKRRPNRESNTFDPSSEAKVSSILDKATPNLDLFVLAFLSGIILGFGYVIDSNAVLMFGIFMTPFLGPWIGLALSSMIGEMKLLRLTAGGVATSLLFNFTAAALVGLISRFVTPAGTNQVYYHSHLWWPDLFMVVIGTIILTLRFIQTDTQPIIPSLMLSYGIFLPLSVSAFGLGAGMYNLFVDGLLVFLVHIAISLIIALGLLIYLGFRPKSVNEAFIPGSITLVSVIVLFTISGFGSASTIQTPLPTATPELSATPNSIAISNLPTETPVLLPTPTIQVTSTNTPKPLATTAPPTLPPDNAVENTGIFGKIHAFSSNGVVIKNTPDGPGITTIENDHTVELLPDDPVIIDGEEWVHVLVIGQTESIDGWVNKSYIIFGTPTFTP